MNRIRELLLLILLAALVAGSPGSAAAASEFVARSPLPSLRDP